MAKQHNAALVMAETPRGGGILEPPQSSGAIALLLPHCYTTASQSTDEQTGFVEREI